MRPRDEGGFFRCGDTKAFPDEELLTQSAAMAADAGANSAPCSRALNEWKDARCQEDTEPELSRWTAVPLIHQLWRLHAFSCAGFIRTWAFSLWFYWPDRKGGGKPGWMLDPTQRGPPEDNTVKCQRMSPCNAINYTLLYLVLSTGYEIVIKTAYLSLVNMQTDDLRELGPLCDEFRVTISCALRLLSLNKLVRVMQMMWELLEIWLERN